MNLLGSKTEKNLLAAFAGESMARNRYTFYASQAKKEGYEKVAQVFELTADNERAHAKQIFKYLLGINDTAENLKNAAFGEHEEWSEIYKTASQVAYEEKFNPIGDFFKMLAEIEHDHEERFAALQKQVEDGTMFKDVPETQWICKNCGHVHTGATPPESCPVCMHPKAFFERKQGS